MTRSKKVARLFRGRCIPSKCDALRGEIARRDFLEAVVRDYEAENHPDAGDFRAGVSEADEAIDQLKRQIFVLENKHVDFDVTRSGDNGDTLLEIPTTWHRHRLYRVVLSDEDEMLYLMKWSGNVLDLLNTHY